MQDNEHKHTKSWMNFIENIKNFKQNYVIVKSKNQVVVSLCGGEVNELYFLKKGQWVYKNKIKRKFQKAKKKIVNKMKRKICKIQNTKFYCTHFSTFLKFFLGPCLLKISKLLVFYF